MGALVLSGWAVLYLAMAWGRFYITEYLQIAGLPFVLGLLFLLNWRYRAEVRLKSSAASTN